MSRSDEDTLGSVSTQACALIRAAHASCEDGQSHVRSSKRAVARSLRLLSATQQQVPQVQPRCNGSPKIATPQLVAGMGRKLPIADGTPDS